MPYYEPYKKGLELPEIVSWSQGTDEQIVALIQAADDGLIDLVEDCGWAVGDERTISLSAMSATGVGESHLAQNATFVLMNVGGKKLADGVTDCNFIVGMKDMLTTGSTYERGYMNSSNVNAGGWESCARRTWCNNVFYNAIPFSIRPIFKQHINKTSNGSTNHSQIINSVDYFAFASEKEVFGTTTYSNSTAEAENTQFEWYKTSANRIKLRSPGGSAYGWWERSPGSGYSSYFCLVNSGGSASCYNASNAYGLSPFGCI